MSIKYSVAYATAYKGNKSGRVVKQTFQSALKAQKKINASKTDKIPQGFFTGIIGCIYMLNTVIYLTLLRQWLVVSFSNRNQRSKAVIDKNINSFHVFRILAVKRSSVRSRLSPPKRKNLAVSLILRGFFLFISSYQADCIF